MNYFSYFLILFLVFLFNFILFKFYKSFALKINLYDYPDQSRKKHSIATPLLGGVYLILNLFLFFFLNKIFNFIGEQFEFNLFLIFSSFIFILGFLDDKFDLKAINKFFILFVIILALINFNENLVVKNLYFETFDLNINLGKYSIFFTILCFMLFINACNMFDGINLQLGLYSLQIFLFLFMNNIFPILSILFCIFLFFYIYLNKNGSIFFGDSGSLLISFLISYLIISEYNDKTLILSCEIIFILMFLPGFDMFRLFLFRLTKRRNPFSPDSEHIHHLLTKKFNFLKSTFFTQLFISFGLISVNFISPLYTIVSLILIYIILIVYLNKSLVN